MSTHDALVTAGTALMAYAPHRPGLAADAARRAYALLGVLAAADDLAAAGDPVADDDLHWALMDAEAAARHHQRPSRGRRVPRGRPTPPATVAGWWAAYAPTIPPTTTLLPWPSLRAAYDDAGGPAMGRNKFIAAVTAAADGWRVGRARTTAHTTPTPPTTTFARGLIRNA